MTLNRLICILALVSTAVCIGCGGDDGPNNPSCGTAAEPTILEITNVTPAKDSTVVNDAIVQEFTIVDSPGIFSSLTLVVTSNHTAGSADIAQLGFLVSQDEGMLHYKATSGVTWTNAPAHVELSVVEKFEHAGCYYAFPEPLFSYDIKAKQVISDDIVTSDVAGDDVAGDDTVSSDVSNNDVLTNDVSENDTALMDLMQDASVDVASETAE